ncbi:DUF2798 domain-containing protein [[Acholeplasma] multilocale]|uniref:DUF2798 domain-containing protein n=1 Tax=[Acholeplasma] multilocale TaxID=264638 RepID=UPI0012EBBA61|nr:DUF2798 domain-containing protein [[Acholeplasma] multilocale]
MSLFLTLYNVGAAHFDAVEWLKEWGIAFVLALPLSAIVTSVVPPLWIKIFKKFDSKSQDINDVIESEN